MLPDQKLEQRARDISGGVRCMVCQNENIDDSNAPLARDLRLLVRERLKKGDSDDQVRDYLVARYGDFVLLKPPLKGSTLILWITPALVLWDSLAKRPIPIGYGVLSADELQDRIFLLTSKEAGHDY